MLEEFSKSKCYAETDTIHLLETFNGFISQMHILRVLLTFFILKIYILSMTLCGMKCLSVSQIHLLNSQIISYMI